MPEIILNAGIACAIAALVGGGLKAAGIEIPLVASSKRQWLLGIFGLALMAVYFIYHEEKSIPSDGAAPIPGVRAEPTASLDEMLTEVQRLISANAKQKLNIAQLEDSMSSLKAQYDDLKASIDRGEGTAEERLRAPEVLASAAAKYDQATVLRDEAIQAMTLASARIDSLQKRIADRR